MKQDNFIEQGSLDWFRARLGCFTGSEIGKLMTSSRSKDELFGKTALSYIYQVAAERTMVEDFVVDDELFSEYLEQNSFTSKAMEWGKFHEHCARDLFSEIIDTEIKEETSVRHKTIPYFASSPDGSFIEKETGALCSVEIKCPSQSVYMKYFKSFNQILTEEEVSNVLYSINKDYYYQVYAHMACTGTEKVFFVVYCPYQKDNIIYVSINRNESVISEIESRVIEANKIVDAIIKT